MIHQLKKIICGLLICSFAAAGISAQAIREEAAAEQRASGALPLRRISIFSSGVAYHEHSGMIHGPAEIVFPFRSGAMNDVLKSLTLNDPASANPFISYPSDGTLFQTLRSLRVDLSGSPDMATILGNLRGAEVELSVPYPVSGRIVGVEHRVRISPLGERVIEPRLSLLTDRGLRVFNLENITSLRFFDQQINDDLNRALDLIFQSYNIDFRDLTIHLPGSGSRRVSVSYVVPAPVWKVSYRLDLSPEDGRPILQGWAIVDNDSDTDWENVELSLVAGRPSSFIQPLYPVFHVFRPMMPLSIAGSADAAAHDRGFGQGFMLPGPVAAAEAPAAARQIAPMRAAARVFEDAAAVPEIAREQQRQMLSWGGAVETAAGAQAGDQFEFTVRTPVTLNRRMSAMLPLTESVIEARRILVFSGGTPGVSRHPRLGAELTNTSGMSLPAGPITVFDGGTYAGSALIEFWNDGERRIISYGEDLSVTGAVTDSTSVTMTSVNLSGGIMTLNRSHDRINTYTFTNTSDQARTLIVEHPITQGMNLASPQADERTASLFRFSVNLEPRGEATLQVRETRPLMQQISLLGLRQDIFLSHVTNQEIPENVRNALQRAAGLRNAVSVAEAVVARAEERRAFFLSEQERIRRNIQAVGNQSPQGQAYIERLMSLDASIDGLTPELESLRAAVRAAQAAFEDYLSGLNF